MTGPGGRFRLAISYFILVILSIASIYPAFWIVLSSFKAGNSLYSETFIPRAFTLEHYQKLFADTAYPLWFLNTLKVAAASTVLGTFFVLCCSYAVSRFHFSGRKFSLNVILVLQMFPGFMGR